MNTINLNDVIITPEAILEKARNLLNITIMHGMAEITSDWAIYTPDYLEQHTVKHLHNQNPFYLKKLTTLEDGTKCSFVISPSNTSGPFDIFKIENNETAYFQIFSILNIGEPDRLDDLEEWEASHRIS